LDVFHALSLWERVGVRVYDDHSLVLSEPASAGDRITDARQSVKAVTMNLAFREWSIEFADEACITPDSGFAIKPVPALLSPLKGLRAKVCSGSRARPSPQPSP
jgi:hypothetical protein